MLSEIDLKKKEGETILEWLTKDDYLVVLDGRGKQMSSEGLADFIQARANESIKNIVFLIGGAYGIDDAVLREHVFFYKYVAHRPIICYFLWQYKTLS